MIKYDKRKFDAYQIPGVEVADFQSKEDCSNFSRKKVPHNNSRSLWFVTLFLLIVIILAIILVFIYW